MGLLDFIKKISGSIEEKEKISLSLEDLDSWIDSKSNEVFQALLAKFEILREKISSEKESLQKNLQILETAELRNSEIPERMKQVMEGNRRIYLQKVRTLSAELDFPTEFEPTKKFVSSFDAKMNNFFKTVSKSHNVMEEFFHEKAGAILANIKNIDRLIRGAKKEIDYAKLEQIKELKSRTHELIKNLKRKETKEEIKTKQAEIKKTECSVEELEKRIKQLNKSDEMSQFNKLKSEKEILEKDFELLNEEMKHSFSEIEAGLKRYSNLNKDDKLAKEFLTDPLRALLVDKELKIVSLLEKINGYIEEGSIELKDKKRDKILKELKSLDKNFFENFFSSLKSIKAEIERINEDLSENSAEKKYSELKSEFDKETAELESKKENLARITKQLEQIDVQSSINNLEKEITQILGTEVKISH